MVNYVLLEDSLAMLAYKYRVQLINKLNEIYELSGLCFMLGLADK